MVPGRISYNIYEPVPLVDLSAKAERERLSSSAIKAFLNIMQRWGVRYENARALLGGMSNGQFYAMKKRPERTLDADTLTRISLPRRHLQGAQHSLFREARRCLGAA